MINLLVEFETIPIHFSSTKLRKQTNVGASRIATTLSDGGVVVKPYFSPFLSPSFLLRSRLSSCFFSVFLSPSLFPPCSLISSTSNKFCMFSSGHFTGRKINYFIRQRILYQNRTRKNVEREAPFMLLWCCFFIFLTLRS